MRTKAPHMLRLLFLSIIIILTYRTLTAPIPCGYNQELEEVIAGELLGTNQRTLSRDLDDFWKNSIHLPPLSTIAKYHQWATGLPPSCTKDAYLRVIRAYEAD